MFVELDPGTASAPELREGSVLPITQTRPDVNFEEILASLDTDTRDYLQLLVHGLGEGVGEQGDALQEVLSRFEPTHRDLARVTRSLSRRARAARRATHLLRNLTDMLASQGEQTERLVDAEVPRCKPPPARSAPSGSPSSCSTRPRRNDRCARQRGTPRAHRPRSDASGPAGHR
jgi:ABC-type transporter Mla subunit MlaD